MVKKSYIKKNRNYKRALTKITDDRWSGTKRFNVATKTLGIAYDLYKLKKMVNVERLSKDFNVSQTVDTSFNSVSNIIDITNTIQGDSLGKRSGISVRCAGIVYNLKVAMHSSATRSEFMLVIFADNNIPVDNVAPVLGDLYTDNDMQSNLDLGQQGRFKLLYKQHFLLQATEWHDKLIKGYLAYDKHIKYQDATNTRGKNYVYLAFVSNEATNVPTITGHVRFRFIDN